MWKLTILFYLTFNYAFAQNNFEVLDKIYSFSSGYKKIQFNIFSEKLNQTISSKLHLTETTKLYANIKLDLKKNISRVLLLNDNKIPLELKVKMKEIYLAKSAIVTGSDIKKWISNYNFESRVGANYFYRKQDPKTNTIEKLKITILEKKIFILEENEDQKSETKYYYQTPLWSFGKWVLSKVERTVTSSKRETRIEAHVNYAKLKTKNWVPKKLDLNSTQRVLEDLDHPINRAISESYDFKNYIFKK